MKINHPPSICIIGAGMSGMLMAIKLMNAGYEDFTVFEKASSVGGTWRENRYPGVACDVASFAYCYEFEPNPNWSRRFSEGPEIRRYFEGVAEKYHLERFIQFNTEIQKAEFINGRWQLTTANGTLYEFDILIGATGPLNQKKYPEIPGLDSFEGACFHTADWDDDYDYHGKKIALIGTGSSAVQSVGPLAEAAEKLTVFQRTPQWIMPTPNPFYSQFEIWLKNKVPLLGYLTRRFYDWVGEQFGRAALKDGWRRKLVEKACANNLKTVKDEVLREKLRPDHIAMCKRMIVSETYYPAIQRENVELITEAIDCITADGVKTKDGKEHSLDLLVLGTGFYPNAWGIKEMVGLNGINLNDLWKQGTRTYKSITMPEFPNFFMLIGPNSPITNLSLIDIADIGCDYVLQCIEKIHHSDIQHITPKTNVTKSFTTDLEDAFEGTVWVTGCNSWYLDQDGIPATWPWAPSVFRTMLKNLDLNDYDVVNEAELAKEKVTDQSVLA